MKRGRQPSSGAGGPADGHSTTGRPSAGRGATRTCRQEVGTRSSAGSPTRCRHSRGLPLTSAPASGPTWRRPKRAGRVPAGSRSTSFRNHAYPRNGGAPSAVPRRHGDGRRRGLVRERVRARWPACSRGRRTRRRPGTSSGRRSRQTMWTLPHRRPEPTATVGDGWNHYVPARATSKPLGTGSA